MSSVIRLSQQQTQVLLMIAEHANQKFLKQSRIRHHKTAFTVLRMLSSYKQMSNLEKFASKEKIYNLIMIMTKYYNPQTYHEWIECINNFQINGQAKNYNSNLIAKQNNDFHSANVSKILHANSSSNLYSNKSYNNQYKYTKPYHNKQSSRYDNQMIQNRNQTVINQIYRPDSADEYIFTKQKFYNKMNKNKSMNNISYNHIQCNAFHSQEYENIHRNLNDEQYPSNDVTQNKLSNIKNASKIHYVSFQPESADISMENKQNLGIYDNQPTRTPFSRSFINNIPLNSNSSPFILSKVTYNTKDVTELDQDESQDMEQWKIMIQRADVFYGINNKMKAFSALMANFQAFGQYRELRTKARNFRKSKLYEKYYNQWKIYYTRKIQQKRLEKLMCIFSDNKICRKIFRVLKVNYELKISNFKSSVQKINIYKYSPMCFDFLKHLLFKVQTQTQQPSEIRQQQQIDNLKSISRKVNHFSETFDSQKMEIALYYFSQNSINKDGIQNIFKLQKTAYLRKSFQIIRQNKLMYQAKIQECLQMRRKQNFLFLLKNLKINHKRNIKCFVMRKSSQAKIKRIIFHSLAQIVYSKKVYKKRQQYLRQKDKTYLKKFIITTWKESAMQKKRNKKNVSQKLSIVCNSILKIAKKQIFFVLKTINSDLKSTEQIIDQHYNCQLLKNVFSKLKKRNQQHKNYCAIKDRNRQYMIAQTLCKWKKLFAVKFMLQIFLKISNSNTFTVLQKQSKFNYSMKLLNQELPKIENNRVFKQLRLNLTLNRQQQMNYIRKVQNNIIKKFQFRTLIKGIQRQKAQKIKNKKEQNLAQRQNILLKYLFTYKKRNLYKQLKQYIQYKRNFASKQKILQKVFFQEELLISNLNNNTQQKSNIANYANNNYIFKQQLKSKKQLFYFLKFNLQIQRSTLQFIKRTRYFHSKYLFGEVKRNLNKKAENKKRCSQYIQKLNYQIKGKILKYFMKQYDQKKQIIQGAKRVYQKTLMFNSFVSLFMKVLSKKEKIQKIKQMSLKAKRKYNSQRLIRKIKEDKIFTFKQINLSIKIFYNRWKKHLLIKQYKQQIRQKCELLELYQKSTFYFKLNSLIEKKSQQQLAEQQNQYKIKKVAMMRLNNALINNTLRQKAVYMAIKYYALRLCSRAFKIIQSANTIEQNRFQEINERKFKIYEHISTEYSSV